MESQVYWSSIQNQGDSKSYTGGVMYYKMYCKATVKNHFIPWLTWAESFSRTLVLRKTRCDFLGEILLLTNNRILKLNLRPYFFFFLQNLNTFSIVFQKVSFCVSQEYSTLINAIALFAEVLYPFYGFWKIVIPALLPKNWRKSDDRQTTKNSFAPCM